MIRDFHSSAHGNITLVPGLPEGFKGPFLKGSNQLYFSEDFGSIVLQEIVSEEFRFQFLFLHFLEKVKITTRILSGLHSIFAAKGEAKHELQGRRLMIRESQFLMVQGIESEWRIELKARLQIQILKMIYSADLAKELAGAFPSYESFLLGKQQGIKGPYSSHAAIRDTVRKILHADHGPEKLPFYLKNKVEDYVFETMDKTSEKEQEKLVATAWEQSAVYKVKDMILANILEHHSIIDLARRAKIDPYRLKVFFKREFGVGPFEFLLNARLDKAKQLMEEGKPMKQAAPLAGYRTTSFITAFKRRFGYSPGKLGKK